jgi:hypothetical protein
MRKRRERLLPKIMPFRRWNLEIITKKIMVYVMLGRGGGVAS